MNRLITLCTILAALAIVSPAIAEDAEGAKFAGELKAAYDADGNFLHWTLTDANAVVYIIEADDEMAWKDHEGATIAVVGKLMEDGDQRILHVTEFSAPEMMTITGKVMAVRDDDGNILKFTIADKDGKLYLVHGNQVVVLDQHLDQTLTLTGEIQTNGDGDKVLVVKAFTQEALN